MNEDIFKSGRAKERLPAFAMHRNKRCTDFAKSRMAQGFSGCFGAEKSVQNRYRAYKQGNSGIERAKGGTVGGSFFIVARGVKKASGVNWNKIRAEYVTSDISLREIAKKYGISVSQVSKRASNEGWGKKRDENRYKIGTKAVQKVIDRNAEKMAAQLCDIGEAAENLAALIARVSTDVQTLNVGRTKRTDTKAVRNLTSALKDLTGVIRDVYELPTFKEKQQMDKESTGGEVVIVDDIESGE